MGVGVSGNESTDSIGILTNGREIGDRQLAINLFSNGQEMLCAGIINQYGQLIGDYSRLDDELWFSKPRDDGDDDDDALPRADQGIELNFKPSYQYTVCKDPVSKSIDNPVSDGGPCMNETSSSLKDSSVYQSQTSSPISVLRRRRSYSNVKKKATKRARSERGRFVKRNCLQGLQSIVPSFPATEQNLSIDPDRNSGSSPLDESTEPNPNPAKQLRTKKICDLLLSGAWDKQANAPEFYTGQALEESEPWEKDQDLIPTPIRKRKLQKMEVKKCMHCESTDTPQWRDGPMGRGTLCNACGVQYRNGRLFPDYRPLKSPIFNPSFHSKLKPTTKREQPKMAKKNCLRCESTETPQSEGSMGRGTLSNVCDVQQKNDMILPEYRPAKSSTFNPSLHSNPKPAPKKEPKMAVMKCMHCESTKTPQWRDGPMGRGTLCNACGVRFRSGKLFPEYRPINSPTFDPSLHSNLFKKVQQIRVDRNAKKSAVSGQSEQQA